MVMNNQTFRNVVIQWCCLVPLMIEQLMCGSSVMQGTDWQASPPRYLCSTNPEKTACWLRAWHMEKVSCSPRLVTVAQLFTTINHLVKDLQLWYIFKKSRVQVQLREKKRNCIHLILAQPITDLYIWERIQNSTHNCVAEGLLTLLFTTINHSVKDPGSYFFSSKNHLILMLTCCPSRTWTLLVFCQGWMS